MIVHGRNQYGDKVSEELPVLGYYTALPTTPVTYPKWFATRFEAEMFAAAYQGKCLGHGYIKGFRFIPTKEPSGE